jgi:UDP-glucose 4-epimerase
MRIAVIGGTGVVGRHTVETLRRSGHDTVVVARSRGVDISTGEGLDDVLNAHLLALERAPSIGFDRYIITATTPFLPEDLSDLRVNAPLVARRRVPEYEVEYARRGWKMFPSIDRVYVNDRARKDLGWCPRYDFSYVLDCLRAGVDPHSPLSRTIGSKGYHARKFLGCPYPVK